ncbi:unnamed protein product [Durusdinium trenchii]|uniref:C2H2-type domain-containing protein n=1 Tax=Durusdinium trenchii TaxID=1381693 RepID=A0ABP0I6N2_9DINO
MVGDVIPLNDLWCVLLGIEIYWTTTHVSSDEKLYLAKALRRYRKTHGSLCLGGYFVDAIVARLMEEKDAGLGKDVVGVKKALDGGGPAKCAGWKPEGMKKKARFWSNTLRLPEKKPEKLNAMTHASFRKKVVYIDPQSLTHEAKNAKCILFQDQHFVALRFLDGQWEINFERYTHTWEKADLYRGLQRGHPYCQDEKGVWIIDVEEVDAAYYIASQEDVCHNSRGKDECGGSISNHSGMKRKCVEEDEEEAQFRSTNIRHNRQQPRANWIVQMRAYGCFLSMIHNGQSQQLELALMAYYSPEIERNFGLLELVSTQKASVSRRDRLKRLMAAWMCLHVLSVPVPGRESGMPAIGCADDSVDVASQRSGPRTAAKSKAGPSQRVEDSAMRIVKEEDKEADDIPLEDATFERLKQRRHMRGANTSDVDFAHLFNSLAKMNDCFQQEPAEEIDTSDTILHKENQFLAACVNACLTFEGQQRKEKNREEHADEEQEGPGQQGPQGPWNAATAKTIMAVKKQLSYELCQDKLLHFMSEWCDTPKEVEASCCYEDCAVKYDDELLPARQIQREQLVNCYLRIPHSIKQTVPADIVERFSQKKPEVKTENSEDHILIRKVNYQYPGPCTIRTRKQVVGNFLLHSENGGSPHCVAVKQDEEDKLIVFDTDGVFHLAVADFETALLGGVDAATCVIFKLQDGKKDTDVGMSDFENLLDLAAGSSESNEECTTDDAQDTALLPEVSEKKGSFYWLDDTGRVITDQVLLSDLQTEAQKFMEAAKAGQFRAERGAFQCPACPFRKFDRCKRLAVHLSRYHTAKRQFCCSGTKQIKIILALHDSDMIAEKRQGNYLKRSATLLRRSIKPMLSPQNNAVDKEIRFLLDASGPRVVHRQALRSARRVGNMYYTHSFAERIFQEMLLNHAKARGDEKGSMVAQHVL